MIHILTAGVIFFLLLALQSAGRRRILDKLQEAMAQIDDLVARDGEQVQERRMVAFAMRLYREEREDFEGDDWLVRRAGVALQCSEDAVAFFRVWKEVEPKPPAVEFLP